MAENEPSNAVLLEKVSNLALSLNSFEDMYKERHAEVVASLQTLDITVRKAIEGFTERAGDIDKRVAINTEQIKTLFKNFAAHEGRHKQDRSTLQWLVGILVAAVAVGATIVGMVLK